MKQLYIFDPTFNFRNEVLFPLTCNRVSESIRNHLWVYRQNMRDLLSNYNIPVTRNL